MPRTGRRQLAADVATILNSLDLADDDARAHLASRLHAAGIVSAMHVSQVPNAGPWRSYRHGASLSDVLEAREANLAMVSAELQAVTSWPRDRRIEFVLGQLLAGLERPVLGVTETTAGGLRTELLDLAGFVTGPGGRGRADGTFCHYLRTGYPIPKRKADPVADFLRTWQAARLPSRWQVHRLRYAAEAGDVVAAINLALALERLGRYAEAEQWYRLAAEAWGIDEAYSLLGDLLARAGRENEALHYLEMGARQGDSDAVGLVGAVCEDFGDLEGARYWYARAAALGDNDAAAWLGSHAGED
jgi:tetratricopeptide (TPR) repeat protein